MENKISIELIDTDDAFRALEPEWNELLRDSRADNIFLTWEWISSWWDVFGGGRRLWILRARENASNRTLGLAPLNIGFARLTKRFPSAYKELSFIGANKASPDHLDFIIRNGYAESVASAFVSFMKSHAEWDLLQLDGLNSTSPVIPPLLKPFGPSGIYRDEEQSAIARLPESWEAFRSQMNKKLRKNVERYIRNLEADFPGKVQRKRIADEDHIIPAMLNVFQLSGQVKESHGIEYSLQEADLIEFHKKAVVKFYQKGWLRLYTICVEEKVIAASYCFSYNDTVSYYQSAYNLDWKHYGAGQQIRAYSVSEAIKDGVKTFDFLRGEHSYKSEWATDTITDLNLQAGYSLKGKIFVALHRLAKHINTLRNTHPD